MLPPEPPLPSPARYLQGSYDPAGMLAHHLREFVALLDSHQVPDDAVVYVYGTTNRGVPMVTFRCDLDLDEDMLGRWEAPPMG